MPKGIGIRDSSYCRNLHFRGCGIFLLNLVKENNTVIKKHVYLHNVYVEFASMCTMRELCTLLLTL